MPALLTAIVVWLSANFGLPANYDFPRIERMSSIEMTNLVYQRVPDDQRQAMSTDRFRRVVSLYSVEQKTIYLQPEWNGRTPAELSMLVHEMVHHLQNVAHIAYACPQEREKLAYEAQEKWLGLFGRDLSHEFQIDPFTLLISTACPTR